MIIEEMLTEDNMKELRRILKQSAKGSSLAWFAVGDYKKRANMAMDVKTAKAKAESSVTAADCFVYEME